MNTSNKKRVLLCLHGYVDSANLFHGLEKLVGDKYRVVAMDFPMVNSNEKIYSLNDLTDYVLDFAKKKKIGSFDLFGFSLGGLVAINTANKSRQVKKLYVANVMPSLLKNRTEKYLFKLGGPLLASRQFCYVYSRFKTMWKQTPRIKQRMKEMSYSVFGTLFNIIGEDLTDKFNNLKIPKHLFLFKDDKIVKFGRYKNKIGALDCNKHLLDYGGHMKHRSYWLAVVPFLGI